MKNISEQIAQWLVEQGITHNFTVTGGGAMFLNQAFGSHPAILSTYMHHEQACAMAAEGFARIAGRPAVVVLTTGPGSINALNGVFGAYTDSIPMIVLSGQVKRETCLDFHHLPDLRQLGDQEGPTIALAKAVCKFTHQIREPEEIAAVLPAAFSAAVSGRPGPVWLDIPLDIQATRIEIDIPTPIFPSRPAASDTEIEEIIARLQTARRPLILGGTGVRLSGATERLLEFVEKLGIPLATAWTHDLIESDHPLFAGRPGTIGTRAGNFCLQNADFVLVLGSRLNIRQTSYNWERFASKAWVAQVDIDPAELHKPGFKPDMTVVSDINAFLQAWERVSQHRPYPSFANWVGWCQDIAQRYHIRREHVPAVNAQINPYLLVDRVFQQLREDDVIVCGNASACILPFQIGHLERRQRLFSNSGSASMGFDLPAALGAAQARGRQGRVICFAGDGSLQMNIQELQTLKTSGANVVIIVLNNGGYLSIWQTHQNFFGRVIGATPDSGVDFPDFTAIATAYGIPAWTIASEKDLPEIETLLARNGPLLINAIVDPNQEFSPRIKSRVDEHGQFVTPELDDMHPFLPPAELEAVRNSAENLGLEPLKSRSS